MKASVNSGGDCCMGRSSRAKGAKASALGSLGIASSSSVAEVCKLILVELQFAGFLGSIQARLCF